MANITMYAYAKNRCPYCVAARQLLTAKGVMFDEIFVDNNPAQREIMVKRSGRNTLPQIFI
jgi:glutaredoxin 3